MNPRMDLITSRCKKVIGGISKKLADFFFTDPQYST